MRFLPTLALVALAAIAGCSSSDEDPVDTDEAALSQQASLVQFYRGWYRKEATIVADVKRVFGAPVESMNADQYARFLASLDLASDDGLMRWGAAVGIEIVALTRSSDFFYYDAHVLPMRLGSGLRYATFSTYDNDFNASAGRIEMKDAQGNLLETRVAAATAVRSLESRRGVSYNKGFADDRLDLDALSGYLAPLSAVANRPQIAEGIASMPLFMIKTLRGKAIYLSLESGRSYAVTMPVGNEVYSLFAGMKPGSFFERNTGTQTPETFVHELCHVIDHTAIRDRYGSILFPYRYPALAELVEERNALFVPRPADRSTGYISAYSATNPSEDFAEHCRAFVREPSRFRSLAQTQAQAGNDLLERKYEFMAKLFQRSPDFVRTSAAIIDAFPADTSGGGSSGPAAPTGCNGDTACQETACLADLADVKNIETIIEGVLGVDATCATSSDPRKITTANGAHYYGADMRCTLAALPSSEKVAGFKAAMEAKSYYGYTLSSPNGETIPVVTAQTTTTLCSSY
jgi:hypothetical protein